MSRLGYETANDMAKNQITFYIHKSKDRDGFYYFGLRSSLTSNTKAIAAAYFDKNGLFTIKNQKDHEVVKYLLTINIHECLGVLTGVGVIDCKFVFNKETSFETVIEKNSLNEFTFNHSTIRRKLEDNEINILTDILAEIIQVLPSKYT